MKMMRQLREGAEIEQGMREDSCEDAGDDQEEEVEEDEQIRLLGDTDGDDMP